MASRVGRRVALLLAAVATVSVAVLLWKSRPSDPPPPPPEQRFPQTHYSDAPDAPLTPPKAVIIGLPAVSDADAIWGSMGRDDRGHIYFGLSAERAAHPSATLVEYAPETATAVARGDVVSQLKRTGVYRKGEVQGKIHSRIIQAADGYLYFTSMDFLGASFEEGTYPPVWGGHLWRVKPGEDKWEHLFAAPEGLIALAGNGRRVYMLGFFGHVLYQYDCVNGKTRAAKVGSVRGHVSRNLICDSREHVYVPRLIQERDTGALKATLVEYDTLLREVGETPLHYYLVRTPGASHGIVSQQHMRDGRIFFITHGGRLHRITPGDDGPAKVEDLGWFHPKGSRYTASLFTYGGERYLLGLSTLTKDTYSDKVYEWVVYDLEAGQGTPVPFTILGADTPGFGDLLLYGSMTNDDFGNAYVVGTEYSRRRPLVLQVHLPSTVTGSLRVAIEPEAARRQGARWRVDGGEWKESGAHLDGIPVGEHVVEYKDVVILKPPESQRLAVVPDRIIEITGRYSPALDCVVDNKDNVDRRRFHLLEGEWRVNTGGKQRWALNDRHSDYQYARVVDGDAEAHAEWSCGFLPAGRYEVYAWWPVFTFDMGRAIPYEIVHADGAATLRVDQNVNGGKWQLLGTYRFEAGKHVVRIHNGRSGPGKYVVADAVRFVKVNDETP